MSLNSGTAGGASEHEAVPEFVDRLLPAYLDTYRGPYGGAPGAEAAVTGPLRKAKTPEVAGPALVAAQLGLGHQRSPGETRVAVYAPDEPAGFGPALQIVTDNATMLMDSVTVLLHRIGVAYKAIMNPVFRVRRNPDGELLDIAPAAHASSADGVEETWVHVQLSRSVDRHALAEAQRLLPRVLADARQVAVDSASMSATMRSLSVELDADTGSRFPSPDRKDVAALLRWLLDGHFVLLGYQRCVVNDGDASVDVASRLGVLRTRDDVLPQLTREDELLALAQATIPSFLRYGAYPQIVVVREQHGEHGGGEAVEHRFVGLFTIAAMNANVLEIPLVSRRVNDALALAHRDPGHPGQLLLDVIQTIPRAEFFALSARALLDMAMAVIDLGSRRRTLLFMRTDPLGYFVSCLVYLPRDRYTTVVRLEMQDILVRELGGESIDYAARVSESPWAVVHFTVRLPEGSRPGDVDVSDANQVRIQDLLTEAARTWGDRLLGAVRAGAVEQGVAEHYATAFPEVYKQAFDPQQALDDIAIIEALEDDSVKLVLTDSEDDGVSHLVWYLGGRSASLSQLLPMLQSMGVVVLEERPFTVTRPDGLAVWIYQFRISPHRGIPEIARGAQRQEIAERFADAVTAIWHGHAEIDRFNELVLRAGLNWRQVAVLRAYAKYLKQAGFSYSQTHIATVVNEHAATARSLVELFEALFAPADPEASETNRRDAQAAAAAVSADIDALVSLDADRVLRAFASMMQATLRTNYFVTGAGSARAQNVLSFKLNPELIDELPLPRPKFEIFVYSPRVEGVHLRFGFVARGGLRWSDRKEDFRTEILGLVKAQAVKNAVIVPVGAKGGFVVKNPPEPTGDAAADREATRDEGVACYRLFIAGLLDITDNVDKTSGRIVAPPQVVRRDKDDAYLVVAADKGTAAFSDIANEVAQSYDFWLGDAFASGGSVGYDHKAMGITAKGAWESVKRHFREMGVDTQSEDFTVVGVGDMSGDVFGNGMLLSRHIRLLAAFDHRHIFIDPDPDAATSWQERKRLFDLPRSSWEDYDPSLISAGGGVYRRDQKSITISAEAREALGIDSDVSELPPPALIRAILKAPADLLFNGGIGTYVKAESEGEVGDRANDAVRVNGNQVRAKVIGEGGNLGVTSLGRIEFDLCGGRINTDALDNSAGVDCSDHEVNIKILIDSLVTAGKVDAGERTELLLSMTDEVGRLVLSDNESQNDLMGTSRANAASVLSVHARIIRDLVAERELNRELEALPSDKEIARRAEAGLGLTSPELATLMAHIKLALKDDLLASDLPDQDVFAARLPLYFPQRLREQFSDEIRAHQLRREMVATMLVNDVVDTAGITYVYRVTEDVGVTPVDAVRSFVAADAIFGFGRVWRQIRATAAEGVSVAVTDRMTLDLRRLVDRSTRWLLNYRPQPLAVGAEIHRFADKVADLTPQMPQWLRGDDKAIVAKEAEEFSSHGVPDELAYTVASGLYQFSLLDVIDVADIVDRDPAEVADTNFALMDHLGTDGLLTAVSRLSRDDRWHSLARLAIRDDIYGSLRALCFDVLGVGEPDESGEEKIAEWEMTNSSRVTRARRTLTELYESGEHDLATLSVAARQIRSMTRLSGTGTAG
ncbi:NAD-glutamate dehydrogenase [Mycolicibacterium duvalii]|uniref:NAD-specific glutamate dehydrogenase n=1 Tax=Mycolicibacterium duvalii TaxID=39688 RepID=A0A7I7JXB7_9MYCO|nr:NAD-glutamate dehydrogenase [Mycolicibacterium duvalii]MCV7370423.1 NAD-glutamate dehydrogenase [Mycolicibacterium duvalii]PEG38146.1 NAD-glutamate dehydrogenase [Mycolicibacterium duvalii]BBX15742.1 NAD-specific glutamate dehydrogenase [Mycolicibacterium duvalii]